MTFIFGVLIENDLKEMTNSLMSHHSYPNCLLNVSSWCNKSKVVNLFSLSFFKISPKMFFLPQTLNLNLDTQIPHSHTIYASGF